MYKEAYELIREILEDDKLNEFVHKTTGKRLAIIDSGPKVTFPAVGIVFRGGEARWRGAMSSWTWSLMRFLPTSA